MKAKLRALGDRWPWLGRALDVQELVTEVNGSVVAAAITLTVFLSLFPLLLVAIAVLGFVAKGNHDLPKHVIDSLGVTGNAADTVTASIERAAQSRRAASIIGLLGLAWSGSAVAVALQQGIRAPWQDRPEGVKDRLRGIALIVVAGIGFAAVIALSSALNFLPEDVPKVLISLAAIAIGLAAELGLFWFLFWALGPKHVPYRRLLPGALLAAVGFEVLKLVGTVYVPHLVASSSALYGPIGVVFAILAWLVLLARLIVYASALNAVLYQAEVGTKEVTIEVPDVPEQDPVAADRGGQSVDAHESEDLLRTPD